MSYDVAGPADGDLVVLLHAGVADRRMWEGQWAALTQRFRVARADLRGYGDTAIPGGVFSYPDDVAELVESLGGGPAALVGASFGGKVALATAASRPDLVSRLVLLCAPYGGVPETPDVEAFDEREEELLEAGDVDGATELNVDTWLGPKAGPEVRDLLRVMQRHAFDVQLAADELPDPPETEWPDVDPARIEQPTLVVSGAHDLEWFGLCAEHLAATMPAARHVALAWAGHLPALEDPAETARLLLEALAPARG